MKSPADSLPDSCPGDVSAGQLLCGGLFSADATSNWLCCAALAQVFAESVQLKEELLRVQLATQVDTVEYPTALNSTVVFAESSGSGYISGSGPWQDRFSKGIGGRVAK